MIKVAEQSQRLLNDLYSSKPKMAAKGMLGEDAEPVIAPAKGDKRFRGDDWESNQIFDFIKQSHLLTSR